MTNMNTSEFLQAVDHAAGMNDRWLFLAAFCLLLLGCGAVIYWLVRQLQAVIEHHRQARDSHQETLTQIVASQNETALKLAVCIDRNTSALEDCTLELRRIREKA
jgi:predicted PurR-regulated permease PerM